MKYKDIEEGTEYLVKVKHRYDTRARTYHARVVEVGVPRTSTGRNTFGTVDPKGVKVEVFATVVVRPYFDHSTRDWKQGVNYNPLIPRGKDEAVVTRVVPFTNVMEPWGPLAERCADQIKASAAKAKKDAQARARKVARQEAIQADLKRRRIKAQVNYRGEVTMSQAAFQGLLRRLDRAQDKAEQLDRRNEARERFFAEQGREAPPVRRIEKYRRKPKAKQMVRKAE